MIEATERYTSRLTALGYSEIAYGVGGIALCRADELDTAQLGYSVDPSGRSLIAERKGGWSSDWLVIGNQIACGDPIFLSLTPPHPVFTAVQGQGEWKPNLVAPSIDTFWDCLDRFRQFAICRSNPVELEENPPDDSEIETYLADLLRLCGHDLTAVGFWATQAEIGMDDERWQTRLERLLETGKLD